MRTKKKDYHGNVSLQEKPKIVNDYRQQRHRQGEEKKVINTRMTRCPTAREPSTGNKRCTQKHNQGYKDGSAV